MAQEGSDQLSATCQDRESGFYSTSLACSIAQSSCWEIGPPDDPGKLEPPFLVSSMAGKLGLRWEEDFLGESSCLGS